jgi:creatinine amidohydrolase
MRGPASAAAARHWGEMHWPEFLELDRERTMVLIPFGSIEQHGPHLRLDEDIQNALTLCELASAASSNVVLVAPPVWWGMAPHHMGFPGTLTLRMETISALVHDLCASMATHGFRRILLVNGHGGNAPVLAATTLQLSADLDLFVSSLSYWSLIPDVLAEVGTSDFGGMGHADEMETSMALYLRPESVAPTLPAADLPDYRGRHEAIDFRRPGPVLTPLDLARDTREGIIGDPGVATRDKGELIVAAVVRRLVEVIDELCERPLPPWSRSS